MMAVRRWAVRCVQPTLLRPVDLHQVQADSHQPSRQHEPSLAGDGAMGIPEDGHAGEARHNGLQ